MSASFCEIHPRLRRDLIVHDEYQINHEVLFIKKYIYTGCPNKKETGTNMPIILKLDKHFNIIGHYLLDFQRYQEIH